jgi:tetratricopeptide (TPR) repeat protein
MPTLETFPRKARGYNEVGLHLLDQGRYEDAYRFLRRSLELEPYQQPIWNNLGRVYERLGQTDMAIRTYERAIGNAPDDATPYFNLGVLYFDKLHKRDTALSYLLKARDLNPLEPDVHYQLSRIYTANGDHVKAKEELDRFNYLKR